MSYSTYHKGGTVIFTVIFLGLRNGSIPAKEFLDSMLINEIEKAKEYRKEYFEGTKS